MHRHRIVALAEGDRVLGTVALVRFLSDAQARELANLHRAKAQYKDALSVRVQRETFNAQGMTTSKEDVTALPKMWCGDSTGQGPHEPHDGWFGDLAVRCPGNRQEV